MFSPQSKTRSHHGDQIPGSVSIATETQAGKDHHKTVTVCINLVQPVADAEERVKEPSTGVRTKKCMDEVVMHTLRGCGMDITDVHSGISTTHVVAFACAHACATAPGGGSSLMQRIMSVTSEPIDDTVIGSHAWQDMAHIDGTLEFTPKFWREFVKCFKFRIPKAEAAQNEMISRIVEMLSSFNIAARPVVVFSVLILFTLVGKNAMAIANDYRFVKSVVGDAKRVDDFSRAMGSMLRSLIIPSVHLENAWVLMLCRATFRGIPLIPKCYTTGTVPVIEQQQPKREVELFGPNLSASQRDFGKEILSQLLNITGNGPVSPSDIPETLKVPAVETPQIPPKPLVINLFPYGCQSDPAEIATHLTRFRSSADTISRSLVKLIEPSERSVPKSVEVAVSCVIEKLAAFANAVGFPCTATRTALFKAAMVAAYGGPCWYEFVVRNIPGCANVDSKRIAVASSIISSIGYQTMSSIASRLPYFALTAMPTELSDISDSFDNCVWAPSGARSDTATTAERIATTVGALTLIYSCPSSSSDWYKQWCDSGLPRSRKVVIAVEEWKKNHPSFPPVVRAAIMSSLGFN